MMNPQPSPKFAANKPLRPVPSAPPASPSPPVAVPPLFRRIDWLALLICFAVVETIYFLTLAPQVVWLAYIGHRSRVAGLDTW